MQTLISTKYQVVIPKTIRQELHLKSGQKMTCIVKSGIIHLVPDTPLMKLRGFAAGRISNKNLRDKTDRL